MAEDGRIAFSTVDSYLFYCLTGGRLHATDDSTIASRTGLYDSHTRAWNQELLCPFDIPTVCLPEVHDNCTNYSATAEGVLSVFLPIRAVVGDQQAVALGQGCTAPGMIKSTHGMGCFLFARTVPYRSIET